MFCVLSVYVCFVPLELFAATRTRRGRLESTRDSARRAEVAFELALRTHPHILDIVGMDASIIRINKVVVSYVT